MSTTLYLRDSSVPVDWSRGEGDAGLNGTTRNWIAYALTTARGGSVSSVDVIIPNGPTNGVEFDAAAGTGFEFISDPLDRDVLIAGTITVNFWGSEAAMSVNAGLGCVIERIDSTGTVQEMVMENPEIGAELGTAAAVRNESLDAVNTQFYKGDRIRVRPTADDAAGTTAVSGTVTLGIDGATAAADGDSYVTFTEDFGFLVDPPGTDPSSGFAGGPVTFGSSTATERIAQPFVMPNDGTATSLRVSLKNSAATTDDVVVAIQADSAGSPSGTTLVSATKVGSDITTTLTQYDLDIADTALSAGLYWFVFSRSGALATPYYQATTDTNNIAPEGSYKIYNTGAWVQSIGTIGYTLTVTPATTTLYLTNTAAEVDPGGATYTTYEAWTSRGGSATSAGADGTTGPATPRNLVNVPVGNQIYHWVTKGLSAFTLSGLVAVNLRAYESVATANMTIRCEIAVIENDGTGQTIWGAANDGVELGTSQAAMTFLVAGDDLAISDGQRLRIRIFADDAPGVAMATGNMWFYWNGPTAAASGDTYITLPQTVTEFSASTPIAGSDSATTADAVASLDAALAPTDSGSGADTSTLTAPYAVTDTATGADVAAVAVPISATDSAAGADASTTTAAIPVTDAGLAADTAPTLGKTVTDAAVGADTSGKGMTATDTAVGADTALVTVPVPVMDAAVGSDASALTAALPVSEAGVGADSWVNTAQAATDTGSGADASAVTVPISVTDTAVGADTVPAMAKPGTDSATAADAISTLARPVSDAATATDTSSVSTAGAITASDSATGTDEISMLDRPVSDAATVADTSSVTTGAAESTAAITSPLPSLTQAAAATVTLTVYDSFNRADGGIGTSDSGHAWIQQTGTWTISTNRAYRSSSEGQSTVVIDSGLASCHLTVDAIVPSGLQDSGVIFGDIDASNYLLFAFSDGTTLRLWKCDAGAFTLLSGPHSVSAYSSTTKQARVVFDASTGAIELWWDGAQIATPTLSSPDRTKYAAGYRQGLREHPAPSGSTTVYFDNYNVAGTGAVASAAVTNTLPALTQAMTASLRVVTGWSAPASDTTFVGAGTQLIVVTAGV